MPLSHSKNKLHTNNILLMMILTNFKTDLLKIIVSCNKSHYLKIYE
uniref:Uncharacterized protein n=1 Tax=Lepeophtheirus salmonis TaxID=72036 RepID=A0A0K2VIE1_LEPSM